LLRAFFLTTVTLSTIGLIYFMAATKPYYVISVHTNPKTLTAPTPAPAVTVSVSQVGTEADQIGRASWYALGLAYPDALTCASRRFPRGTYLNVIDEYNGKSVTCLVNDYGPAIWTGRVIDLSRGSFSQVDFLGTGTIPVHIHVASAPPVTINGQMRQEALGSIQGYTACLLHFSSQYCDNNRETVRMFN
jgi:rare lipoprotein A (peptidoglycan hydrolase)